ncbi:MAG: PTS sugar transporter subunit IIB [Hespellia sp.]|jgi:D-glucosaminate-specific PTS system IIB component|nr:PTS sugar transporter subunit IIB [Hespellia sp.]
MAEIALVRLDSRLIHGQVCTAWLNGTQANRIIVVDDSTAKDKFLSQILLMAAPKGIKTEIMTSDTAAKEWKENQIGTGKILLLFKSVEMAHCAYFKGFDYPEIQIGGIGGGKNKKAVVGAISINESECKLLQELNDAGCNVYFQILPHNGKTSYQEVKNKFFADI